MGRIPKYLQDDLDKQNAARAKARENASDENFRSSFIALHAQEIEMIRRGAIVTETRADQLRAKGRVPSAEDERTPVAFALPNGKPTPTREQAVLAIWWSRVTRPLRTFYRKVIQWIQTR